MDEQQTVPPEETPVEQEKAPNPLDQYDKQADLIIGGAVVASAGMGWVPAFIDTGWLVASNSAMIASLAVLYKYKWTGDNTREFIFRLMNDSGLTFLSVKALAGLISLTGIGFGVGVAMNGAVNGALTLALGKAAQHYFKQRGDVPDDELVKLFRQFLKPDLSGKKPE